MKMVCDVIKKMQAKYTALQNAKHVSNGLHLHQSRELVSSTTFYNILH